jgi:hypothetical protein
MVWRGDDVAPARQALRQIGAAVACREKAVAVDDERMRTTVVEREPDARHEPTGRRRAAGPRDGPPGIDEDPVAMRDVKRPVDEGHRAGAAAGRARRTRRGAGPGPARRKIGAVAPCHTYATTAASATTRL